MKLFLLLALNGIGEELIVDPCCGSENLSLEAIRHLKSLGCDYREKPLQDEYIYHAAACGSLQAKSRGNGERKEWSYGIMH